MIAVETNREPADQPTVTRIAARLVEDIVLMVELQWQLFLSDARRSVSEVVGLAAIAAMAVVLALAAMFFGLATIALKLISEGMAPAESCGLVALAAIIAAGALLLWAWTRMRRLSGAFHRSRTEVGQNVSWIKEIIAARKGDLSHS